MDSPAPQTPFPTPDPVKHRQLPLLTAILSLLVLSVIAALAYQNFILKKQLDFFTIPLTEEPSSVTPDLSSEAPEENPTASQAPNSDLADWKTYTNSKQNYQVSYPAEFSATKDISASTKFNRIAKSEDVEQDIITISEDGKTPQITIDVVSEQDSNIDKDAIKRLELSVIKIGDQTTFTDSRVYIPENMGPAVIFYYVLYNNKVYKITTFIDYKANDFASTKQVFDQILSTFQFLD